MLGSETSKFALSLWAWQSTGKATTLSISLFFAYMPGIILGPIAGALADRFDRKRLLILCEAAGALISCALLVLITTKGLMIWHIYLVTALYSTIQAFKVPTLAASVPAMVSRNHYIRANSIHKFAESSATFMGPMLGALLLQMIGLRWIVIVDVISFVIAGLAIAAADLRSHSPRAAWGMQLSAPISYALYYWPAFNSASIALIVGSVPLSFSGRALVNL
ncbi:MAG: MFS transporter [Elusimicrobia bacterium]|nr:MFS transporter [Elusimicrobiota bacterium]